MIDRRDVVVGSATTLAVSLVLPSISALAQSASVPGPERGFLERPGCLVYYEVSGSGPPVLFVHGIGSNHLTWWQQVPHFFNRYTCITFSHRGFAPSSGIGVPDPNEFAADLAALIEHLRLPDVRLVAQSMGGLTSIEYILANPKHRVRALVLASTAGTVKRSSVPSVDPKRLAEWQRNAAAVIADLESRGISPPAGERMAMEQPELHFLYQAMTNASGAFDREELRNRTAAMVIRPADVLRGFSMPTLFITGMEDNVRFPSFVADGLAALMPNAKVEHVPKAGHSVYFQRPEVFNGLVDNFFSKLG
jgi:3-oxoadipate enol-lactonase